MEKNRKVFVNSCKVKYEVFKGKGYDNIVEVFLRIKLCLVGYFNKVFIEDKSFSWDRK